MSQSLVPKIKMSRGNNRKTKFNVSSNTHTTAEIGYLQPTYSKMLLPNSDLKLKVHDFCRMSSLVVPSFGELSLRHWFNCTPLSSLWSCYGGYMAQSQYPDYDSLTGTSVRRFMPMASVNEILNLLGKKDYDLAKFSFYGNIIYMRNKATDTGKTAYGIMSFTDFYTAIIGTGNGSKGYLKEAKGIWSGLSSATQEDIKPSDLKRQRLFYNAFIYGVVVKNDNSLMKHVTKSDGTTSFPSPTECPYVLLRGYSKSYEDDTIYNELPNKYYVDGNSSAISSHTGSFEIFPFTTRMFQGDTTNALYVNGWPHNQSYYRGTDSIYYACHTNGVSNGWSLQPNDSYFTGELSNDSYDFSGYTIHMNGSSEVVDYAYGLTYSKRIQRLRKLFIGLGYQFNPTDTQPQTLWKLMHYYKAWFDMFYPKRDTQYYQTPLARIVQFMSYHGDICRPNSFDAYMNAQGSSKAGYDGSYLSDWCDLLFAIADAKYLLPIDYYSLADPAPQQTEGTKQEDIKDNQYCSAINNYNLNPEGTNTDDGHGTFGKGVVVLSNNMATSQGGIAVDSSVGIDGYTIKLAEKLTQFLVKKRIVGKSISDRMRAIYGAVDPHDKSHECTWCFGTTSTGININAVVSQAETEELHLGDFAGQGYGGSSSRTFSVDGNDADIYIVTIMSAIVPKIAYYQGHSRENMVGISPNEFITPLWDGIGYDDVHASEYIADISRHDVATLSGPSKPRTMAQINGQVLGLVPRGTWYKVNGHDILNGDMSLPRTKDNMSPYVLTKDIDRNFGISPIEMRTVNPSTFNKIFNESNDLDDHFIIQMHIEADMFAPLKSISTSYETFDDDEDGTIEVSHC